MVPTGRKAPSRCPNFLPTASRPKRSYGAKASKNGPQPAMWKNSVSCGRETPTPPGNRLPKRHPRLPRLKEFTTQRLPRTTSAHPNAHFLHRFARRLTQSLKLGHTVLCPRFGHRPPHRGLLHHQQCQGLPHMAAWRRPRFGGLPQQPRLDTGHHGARIGHRARHPVVCRLLVDLAKNQKTKR